ncbi:MAG: PLP-dependent aminotransferase family protein [Lachnospiraceae bacterium]|nr:PLP-dependent aminotransferase family protein [Lachnospiraceae bacterium]
MKELPVQVQLNPSDKRCLYEQIYEFIREEIRSGNLLTGEKLPSSRYLAESLQVSRTTVDMAYGQLVSEGYLEARPHWGYFVCEMEELYDIPVTAGRFPEHESGENGSRFKEHIGKHFENYRYDFSPNAIDMSLFPYATWKKITKNILVDARSSMFALGEPQGDWELRVTISRYLHASRGVNCKPEQIIIGAGNDYLLLLLEKILGRHIPVAMEDPTYKRACRIFQSFAYPVSFVPMDEGGMRLDALKESGAQLAYVMPAHQYPTGIVMPIGRRMELLRWASEKEERYLIEDDYDSEFRYRSKPIPALKASDKNDKVIYIGTFSKAIAPAIRISYMVLPVKLLTEYREKCGFYSSTVSRIDQTILNEFIQNGYFERYLNKMRKYYKFKHDLMLSELKAFEKDFVISGENAGLHMLLTDRKERTEEELRTCAEDAGIKVYPMGEFYMQTPLRAERKAAVILGYGALPQEDIVDGLHALKAAYHI